MGFGERFNGVMGNGGDCCLFSSSFCTEPNEDRLERTVGDRWRLLLLLWFDCMDCMEGKEGTLGMDFIVCMEGIEGMDGNEGICGRLILL